MGPELRVDSEPALSKDWGNTRNGRVMPLVISRLPEDGPVEVVDDDVTDWGGGGGAACFLSLGGGLEVSLSGGGVGLLM